MSDLRDRPPRDHGPRQAEIDAAAAEELRAHPGKWAKVRTAPTRVRAQSIAYRVRSGLLASFRRGFLADAITTDKGRHEVWATYRPGLADRDSDGSQR